VPIVHHVDALLAAAKRQDVEGFEDALPRDRAGGGAGVRADLWFDPSCPCTWLTSRWLIEVTRVRDVSVGWHLMSLSVLRLGHPRGRVAGLDRRPPCVGRRRTEGLLGEARSTEWDDAVRASHAAGIGLVGDHVGTPVIAAGGTAFFGPVISGVPVGDAAGRLWDGVLLVAGTDGFHELKGGPR
jgi:hypothetical protein